MRAEGFSCSLNVLFGGIYRDKQIAKNNFSCKVFQFVVIKTLDPDLDPDRYSTKNAESGSGSGLNESGYETLFLSSSRVYRYMYKFLRADTVHL